MNRNTLLLVFSALIIGLLFNSFYIVDEKQKAIVFQFGEQVRTDVPVGFHIKAPIIQEVKKYDARIQSLDEQPDRILTIETKYLLVDTFIKYKISDVLTFYKANSGSFNNLNNLLGQRSEFVLKNEFGKRTVKEVVSGERDELMDKLTLQLDAIAVAELGVEVIDLRVKKIDLPPEVSDSVYNRMRTERERLAKELRAQGNEVAENIRATADKEKTIILADAYRQAEEIKGNGDAIATATYANAYSKDPEFYDFTRSLKAYQSTFGSKSDILLINPDSDFFKYLDNSKVTN